MRASDWEFRNRAVIFGVMFGITFPLYALDPQNSASAFADMTAHRLGLNPDLMVRVLFGFGALLMCVAALTRTWASAYLNASVVYAADVKSASLVADGPYRHVRNPLYFANVLMAVSLGLMMSRLGMGVAIVMMLAFCYRLIAREEADLLASQGDRFQTYLAAVPRLWPAVRARVSESGRKANWPSGLKAEAWYWGFALATIAFALTLKLALFFVILAASILMFWVASSYAARKAA